LPVLSPATACFAVKTWRWWRTFNGSDATC
jgi:hypothetical protein